MAGSIVRAVLAERARRRRPEWFAVLETVRDLVTPGLSPQAIAEHETVFRYLFHPMPARQVDDVLISIAAAREARQVVLQAMREVQAD